MLEIKDENFSQEVLKSELPVLVDFWAPWCGPCRMVAPVLEKLAEKFAGKLKIAKLNVDEAPQTAGSLGVSAIPTLILFKAGKEAERKVGFSPEETLSQFIEANL